jgi:hypothetical protein
MGFKSRGVAGGGEAEVAETVEVMRGLDMGDWSRAAVENAIAGAAWRGAAPEIVQGRTREALEPVAISKGIAVGEAAGDFARWLELGKRVLGEAAAVMGGPGPFVRWRGRQTSTAVRRDGDRIVVELMATERYEHEQYGIFEWGEGLDGLPYHWMGFRTTADIGGMTTSGRLVYSWDEVERAIAMTTRTVRDDVLALRGYGLAFKIALKCRDRSRREVALVLFPNGEMDAFCDIARSEDRLDDAAMRALGWQAPWVRNRWRCDYDEATDAVCDQVAAMMRKTLAAWKVPLAESNTDRGKVLTYNTMIMKGWAEGQDENIAALPLRPIDLTSIGLQRF